MTCISVVTLIDEDAFKTTDGYSERSWALANAGGLLLLAGGLY